MKWMITGGCGFIGCNATSQLVQSGDEVMILDNLDRPGAQRNRAWLESLPGKLRITQADIRDANQIQELIHDDPPDVLLHLAAQVAVTTSVQDPRTDFEINALGTLNLLEAVRIESPGTIFLYASTNKVYGNLSTLRVEETETHYQLLDHPYGVDELQPLDFYSPYGCSKGVADQYVLDYARVYDLRTVVFRQSCIYGPHQYGVEDQGWLAWMTIAALTGQQITLYGNGKQVRDVLHVDDLVRCYQAAVEQIDRITGEVFNMGGGSKQSVSLIEFLQLLEVICKDKIIPNRGPTRPGDQPFFVADIRKAERMLGWKPHISVVEGVEQLVDWVMEEIVNGPSDYSSMVNGTPFRVSV